LALDIFELFKTWRQQIKSLNENKTVIVSCSGGSDSVALLHLLSMFFQQEDLCQKLAVLHFNYGLRQEESDRDERFVAQLAKEKNINFFSYDVKKNHIRSVEDKDSTQVWARNIRYQVYQKHIDNGCVVAVAHTQDDVAENAILRMARGTSPGSLRGMSTWHKDVWRPVLHLSKASLLGWLEEKKLSFCLDSSNLSCDYSRNLIRHEVLPLLENLYPGAKRRIAGFALESQDLTRALMEGSIEDGASCLSISKIKLQNPILARNIIARFLRSRCAPRQVVLSRQKLKVILENVLAANKSTFWKMQVSSQYFLCISRGEIFVQENT
tara:strand:- start:4461 stop:5435 length:975 start_codon:yes stop_codon:yes gene_type:complete